MTFLLSEVSGGDSHSQSGQANKQAAQQQNKPNKTHSLTAGPGPVQHKPTQNKTKTKWSRQCQCVNHHDRAKATMKQMQRQCVNHHDTANKETNKMPIR